jgi:hypothetical protein
MRAGASIAKEIVRRIDELFAIERESPFADPGESVNRFEEQSSAPKPPQSRPSTAQTQSGPVGGLSWPAASLPSTT